MEKIINELLIKHNKLKLIKENEFNFYLEGIIILNKGYNELSFYAYEEIEVRIIIPKNYPKSLPLIYELSSKLDKKFHINQEGDFCLATEIDIKRKLYPDYSIDDWIEKFVFPFCLSSIYYKKHGIPPFGERSHGEEGIVESIFDLFDACNEIEKRILLKNLLLRKYKRSINYKNKFLKYLCPCGSNKKINICHKKEFQYFIDFCRNYNSNIIKDIEEFYERFE